MESRKMGKQDYHPSIIEKKWQEVWNKEKIYFPNLDAAKKPFYNLMMFPYPSAEGMHVGNMYAFTGADVYGRFKRMQGFDVFEPMGLDGFGIHSENYAIKVGRHPKEQAKISEKNFYLQLRATGNGFDWSRKVETYDPKYYKWTQWLFIQLFKKGLAYRKKAAVNFCPQDKTVLADEQVIDGKCERCSSVVEKRDLEQWFFKITDYADRLLAGLDKIDWSEKVKIAQRQWIGRSEGARISFVIPNLFRDLGSSGHEMLKQVQHDTKKIEVFTTRPDTLYGATFLVLSPEHPIVSVILNSFQNLERSEIPKQDGYQTVTRQVRDDIEKYVQDAKKKTEQERMAEGKDKTGVFSRLYAINPLNQEKIPVWIADYAVMGYGTGALFGDAHDERDVKFAKKYGIPLKVTVITGDEKKDQRIKNFEECFTGYGTLIDSGEFSGLTSEEAKNKITTWLKEHKAGGSEITYHLRDWLISRQRYWGPPIPMVYCEACAREGRSWFTISHSEPSEESHTALYRVAGDPSSRQVGTQDDNEKEWVAGWYPVAEKDLPVLLPDVKDWKPHSSQSSSGQAVQGPLANHPEFYKVACPNCGSEAKRETDISDNFLDSAWYFLRYVSTDVESSAFDIDRVKKWLPVEMYIGGAEHSVLHLLYSRFITMALKDLEFVEFNEPFSRFYAHGLLIKERAKMSKSKGNVVVPDEYIRKYGADTLRCYLMFLGPFNQGGDFYDTGIEGMYRFLNRVWRLFSEATQIIADQNAEKRRSALISVYDQPESAAFMHKTIKKVTEDIERLRYNTAIASLMEWYNFLNLELRTKNLELTKEEIEIFLKLLAPFAPHMTEELWEKLRVESGKLKVKFSIFNSQFSIHTQPWPKYDPKFLEEDEVTIVVQVNGKVRETIKVESGKLKVESYVEELARKSKRVGKYLEGKSIKKVVYVEGKVINFVTD